MSKKSDHPDEGRARRRITLARLSRGPDRLLGPVFALTLALLVAGLVLPVMTVRTLVVFEDRISILEALVALARAREVFLFLAIFVFSVVFPVLKIGLAVKLWYLTDITDPRLVRTLRRIEHLGKWSMLDVFVVALLVVAVKLSVISNATVHVGIYLFAASVILSIVALRRATHVAVARRRGHAITLGDATGATARRRQ